jgi:hypothetical protein
MTTAFEEFLSHINRRILLLETELKRLQDLREGIATGSGTSADARIGGSAASSKSSPRSSRKVA